MQARFSELGRCHEWISWLDCWLHDFNSRQLLKRLECRCSPSPKGWTGQRPAWAVEFGIRTCEDIHLPGSTVEPHPNCLRTDASLSKRTFRMGRISEPKTQSPDSSRRSGLWHLLLPRTDGLRHVSSLPDDSCSQIPRMAVRWITKASTTKRRNRFLESLKAMAFGHDCTGRYAGNGRITSCRD